MEQPNDSPSRARPIAYLATAIAVVVVGMPTIFTRVSVALFILGATCLFTAPTFALDLAARVIPTRALSLRRWKWLAIIVAIAPTLLYAVATLGGMMFDTMALIVPGVLVGGAIWGALALKGARLHGLPESKLLWSSAALAAVIQSALLLYIHADESTLSAVREGSEPERMVAFVGSFGLTLLAIVFHALRTAAYHGEDLGRRAKIGWSALALILGVLLVVVDRRFMVDIYPAFHLWLQIVTVCVVDAGLALLLVGLRLPDRPFIEKAKRAPRAALVLFATHFLLLYGMEPIVAPASDPKFRARVARSQIGFTALRLHPRTKSSMNLSRAHTHPDLDFPNYHDYQRPPNDFNVILISIDAMRADLVGLTEEDKARTPTLSTLASEGIYFPNAYAPGSRTAIGMGCLMVGRYSANIDWRLFLLHGGIGGTWYERSKLTKEEIKEFGPKVGHTTMPTWPEAGTLAQRMQKAGFFTMAAPYAGGNAFFKRGRGYDLGFDEYHVFEKVIKKPSSMRVMSVAIRQIKQNRKKRFFQWIHLYDPHQSGNKFEEYEKLVFSTDAAIGALVNMLKRYNLYEKTVIVVVGDHGEGFGRHPQRVHASSLYDDQVLVPLIVRIPGQKPLLRDDPATTLDATATILALGGASMDELDGINLLRVLDTGEYPKNRPVFTELHRFLGRGGRQTKDLKAVIRGDHKLILNRARQTLELYDRKSDPNEAKNIVTKDTKVADDLGDLLSAFLYTTERLHPLPGKKKTTKK